MTLVTRPGFSQTLQETRRQREEARQKAIADLRQRRDGRDASIEAINQHCRQERRSQRRRLDGRTAAAEFAERVFAGQSEEEGQE